METTSLPRTLYARNCEVNFISKEESDPFVADNHSQGKVSVKTINVGLLYKCELVGIAQFSAPRTTAMKEEYTRELVRLAFKKKTRIIGGASKLIKFYIREKNPADIFTYQDTTGEVTSVYEHCGFTLVKEHKTKKYLVAPGKSIATGTRKEVLGLPYATRYGPDRILGTKLGEVNRSDGTRKTNVLLFIEELGWHLEEVSGDRIYEWINPEVSFYTYKLTATDSSKYYYGVKSIKKLNPTIADCTNDGYLGSGTGKEFISWKNKHTKTLHKEILHIHSRKTLAYAHEADLIKDLWQTDPNCLNSTWGGKHGGLSVESTLISNKECPTHGKSKHIGDSCYQCFNSTTFQTGNCVTHGTTKHKGGVCHKCKTKENFSQKECPEHGLTIFRKNTCEKCTQKTVITLELCSLHGKVKHRGTTCSKCTALKSVILQTCDTHGASKHQGGICITCRNQKQITLNICTVHGETAHLSGHCQKCIALQNITLQECPTHGLTKFAGSKCSTCHAQKTIIERECPTHGLTKHAGLLCSKCASAKLYTEQTCSTHGLGKFRGSTCQKCIGEKVKHAKSHKTTQIPDCQYCTQM